MRIIATYFLLVVTAFGANSVATFSNLRLTATFNCVGVVVDQTGDDNSNSVCAVQYRPNSVGTWLDGLNLRRHHRQTNHAGSIVYLTANTTYQVRVEVSDADGVPATAAITNTVTTRNDNFAIGDSNNLSSSVDSPVTISSGGASITSYYAYGPVAGRITIQCSTNIVRCMTVNADNVLLRNIDFIGARTNAVLLNNGKTNLVVHNCTFTGWGTPGKATGPGTFPDEVDNTALLLGSSFASGCGWVTVQHCTFHTPNGGANSWDDGHPTGPEAIFFTGSIGQNVVRYNRIYSIANRWYNDAIGGAQNESDAGFVYADSDIHGNIISESWDDAIECDGGGRNVRIWGNYFTNSHVALSTAAITIGPVYVFRNVFTDNVASEANANTREAFHKVGWAGNESNQGPCVVLFNTVTDPKKPNQAMTGGTTHHLSRNNIFATAGRVIYEGGYTGPEEVSNSYDWDMLLAGAIYDGPAGTYANKIEGTATFTTGSYGSPCNGYFLTAASAGYHAGTPINNFGADTTGAVLSNPNVGAFDERFASLQFGPTDFSGGSAANAATDKLNVGVCIRR